MRDRFRFSFLVGAALVLSFGVGLDGMTGFNLSPAHAQGNSDGKGGDRGQSADKGGDRGNSSNSPGHSGTFLANNGKNSTSGPHQLAEELGFPSMGEFSSWLKSWRSAYRNVAAYEATEGNLNSLPGRQYAYGEAYFNLQTAQSNYDTAFAACAGDTACEAEVEADEGELLAAAQTIAGDAFLATLPGNPTEYDPALRDDVDALIVQLSGANAGLF